MRQHGLGGWSLMIADVDAIGAPLHYPVFG